MAQALAEELDDGNPHHCDPGGGGEAEGSGGGTGTERRGSRQAPALRPAITQ
jgi:hypothetical protein